MNNEQTDTQSENSEDSIMHKAVQAWVKWANDNSINLTNTSPETYKLMAEAFIEAYRTPEYAYPIQRFKSEYDDAKEFVIGFLQVSLVISLVGLIAYALYSLFAV